jgi:integrase
VGTKSTLTDSQIRAMKPAERRYKVGDIRGLYLFVEPSGTKTWRVRWKDGGQEKTITLGPYPSIGLAEARRQATDIVTARGQGLDPVLEARRKAAVEGQGRSFKDVAEAYMARQAGVWSAGHAERFAHRMRRDVIPVIGDVPVADLRPIDVMRCIEPIERRGAQETAVRVCGMIGQVARFAVARGLAREDPTLHLRGGLDHPPRPIHRPAIIDRHDLGRLLSDLWNWSDPTLAKPLLQIGALTFQRPGEIRSMRWGDVDADRAIWSYRVSKIDVDHLVPLSRQALRIIEGLRPLTGRHAFVFASQSSTSGYISDVLGQKLLAKLGWNDVHCGHGWRATARTRIVEDLGVPSHLVERQLSHAVPGAHGRAYNRAEHLAERRAMMQRYADLLDDLREQATRDPKANSIH